MSDIFTKADFGPKYIAYVAQLMNPGVDLQDPQFRFELGDPEQSKLFAQIHHGLHQSVSLRHNPQEVVTTLPALFAIANKDLTLPVVQQAAVQWITCGVMHHVPASLVAQLADAELAMIAGNVANQESITSKAVAALFHLYTEEGSKFHDHTSRLEQSLNSFLHHLGPALPKLHVHTLDKRRKAHLASRASDLFFKDTILLMHQHGYSRKEYEKMFANYSLNFFGQHQDLNDEIILAMEQIQARKAASASKEQAYDALRSISATQEPH